MTKTLRILSILLLFFSCKKADPKKALEISNLKDISSQPIVPFVTSSKTNLATTSLSINDIVNTNGNLYVVGNFSSLGTASSRCIASYNGSTLSGVSNNLASGSNIRAISYYNNRLVLGGMFTTTTSATTRYFGTLQNGSITASPYSISGQVFCLYNVDNVCYASGNITSVAGNWCTLGQLDQNNLYAYGNNVNSSSPNVNAISKFNGYLFMGGSLTNTYDKNIVRHNGWNWEMVGSGFNSQVYDLINFDNKLFAGGSITAAGTSTTSLNYVNQLSEVGNDWEKTGTNNLPAYCSSLEVHKGQLLACGSVGNQGYLYRYNKADNTWENCLPSGFSLKSLTKITSYNGALYGVEKDLTSGLNSFIKFND